MVVSSWLYLYLCIYIRIQRWNTWVGGVRSQGKPTTNGYQVWWFNRWLIGPKVLSFPWNIPQTDSFNEEVLQVEGISGCWWVGKSGGEFFYEGLSLVLWFPKKQSLSGWKKHRTPPSLCTNKSLCAKMRQFCSTKYCILELLGNLDTPTAWIAPF